MLRAAVVDPPIGPMDRVTSLTGFDRRPNGLMDDDASVRDITHTFACEQIKLLT
jgi:hypothetical protein